MKYYKPYKESEMRYKDAAIIILIALLFIRSRCSSSQVQEKEMKYNIGKEERRLPLCTIAYLEN